MKIIGITGGVGAGKTQILEYLSDKYGASVCQTDKVAKKLQKGLAMRDVAKLCGVSMATVQKVKKVSTQG